MKSIVVFVGTENVPAQQLSNLLDHLWNAELLDYRKTRSTKHVFQSLVSVANWVKGGDDRTADDYVAEYEADPRRNWLSSLVAGPAKSETANDESAISWTHENNRRYRLPGRSDNVTVIVGWDRPLQTYFAQVWEGPNFDGDYEAGELVLWVGTELFEVATVLQLANLVRTYVEIPSGLWALLDVARETRK